MVRRRSPRIRRFVADDEIVQSAQTAAPPASSPGRPQHRVSGQHVSAVRTMTSSGASRLTWDCAASTASRAIADFQPILTSASRACAHTIARSNFEAALSRMEACVATVRVDEASLSARAAGGSAVRVGATSRSARPDNSGGAARVGVASGGLGRAPATSAPVARPGSGRASASPMMTSSGASRPTGAGAAASTRRAIGSSATGDDASACSRRRVMSRSGAVPVIVSRPS